MATRSSSTRSSWSPERSPRSWWWSALPWLWRSAWSGPRPFRWPPRASSHPGGRGPARRRRSARRSRPAASSSTDHNARLGRESRSTTGTAASTASPCGSARTLLGEPPSLGRLEGTLLVVLPPRPTPPARPAPRCPRAQPPRGRPGGPLRNATSSAPRASRGGRSCKGSRPSAARSGASTRSPMRPR